METFVMYLGFALSAYAVVGNDALQTLGTFMVSNAHRRWYTLWAFASSIMVAVLVFSWSINSGDVSYGKLSEIPIPGNLSLWYLLPPLALMTLTRFGMPVSTTFLVLTTFSLHSTGKEVFDFSTVQSMVIKSGFGYLVAAVVGLFIYSFTAKALERKFINSKNARRTTAWVVFQWLSTGFLWSFWLQQDLANIFVYMPRGLALGELLFGLVVLVALQGYIFYSKGGEIQKIVTSKTNTVDIRSATIIDFLYAVVLAIFKFNLFQIAAFEDLPMSTTWVFLGLLAGRELSIRWQLYSRQITPTLRNVGGDVGKALVGLVVSVVVALVIAYLA